MTVTGVPRDCGSLPTARLFRARWKPKSSQTIITRHRFRASVALGADPWAAASFWASQPDIMLDVQFSLDGGASFISLVQGAVDSVSISILRRGLATWPRPYGRAGRARTQEHFRPHASEIASMLAARHHLSPRVSPTTTVVGRYYQSEHDRITLDQFSHATTDGTYLASSWLGRKGLMSSSGANDSAFQPATQTGDLGNVSATGGRDRPQAGGVRLTLARDIEVVVKSWNSQAK